MELVIAFLTLTFLEIVLGVDNIIFISIVTNKLPKENQQKARIIGLVLALVLRVVLLATITWLITHLTEPLFTVSDKSFSVREIILMAGGLFLLAKSTSEIFEKMEDPEEEHKATKNYTMTNAILQIIALDIVFSFDSILTAVGLTNDLMLMVSAVVVSMVIMMVFAKNISQFIQSYPSMELLALSFLILIGFMLILEGVHIEVPKGYIYFAVFFSLIVEVINIRTRKKKKAKLKAQQEQAAKPL